MQRGGDMWALCVQRRTDRPAQLPVRIAARAEKARTRREDEVASQTLPDEMEIVVVGPHVLAGSGDRVRLAARFVRPGAGPGAADIGLPVEDADRARPLVLCVATACISCGPRHDRLCYRELQR